MLFLVGMAIALAQLPPNDWSALLMTDRFDLSAGQAGLGICRGGDRACSSDGLSATTRPIASGSNPPAAAAPRWRRSGWLIAATAPHPLLAGCGLFVAGLGLSSLFPLLFRAASELTHGSHSGMASFSSGARLGFLLASPLMGLVADATSVAVAMVVVAGMRLRGRRGGAAASRGRRTNSNPTRSEVQCDTPCS